MHVDHLLEFNRKFVEERQYEQYRTEKLPRLHIAILSCMDTRLTELLPAALGIKNGDAKIIKNAGAVVSHPWGSVMRSLILAVYELQVREICVVAHRDCGLQGLSPAQALAKAEKRGIPSAKLDLLKHAGIDLEKWFTGFSCVEENVRQTVARIREHPLLPADLPVHGLVIDPTTGELELVCRYENTASDLPDSCSDA